MLIYDQRLEAEVKDCIAARKVQKADREKLRRDRLNDQFTELGNALGKQTSQLHAILKLQQQFIFIYFWCTSIACQFYIDYRGLKTH